MNFNFAGQSSLEMQERREDSYQGLIAAAKDEARRYAALETREGRTAAVAVLRFARRMRTRQRHLNG